MATIHDRIKILLETPKGSVPHNPQFGSDIYKYIDGPENRIKPLIIASCYRDLKQWIPNFKIEKINYSNQDEKNIINITGVYQGQKEIYHEFI